MKNLNLNYDMKNTFKLGLDLADLCILRWFDNLVKSGNAFRTIIDDEQYYLIQYSKLMKEVPVLYIKKGAIYKKLQIMTEKKILKKVLIKELGRYNYYTFGENYNLLLPRPEPGADDTAHGNNDAAYDFNYGTHQDNDTAHDFSYGTHQDNDTAHNSSYGIYQNNDTTHSFNYGTHQDNDITHNSNYDNHQNNEPTHSFNYGTHQNNDAAHDFDHAPNKNAAPADEFDVEAHVISNHTEMLGKILEDDGENLEEDSENTAEPAQKYFEYTPINSQALHHGEHPTYQGPEQKINNNYTRPKLDGIALGLLLYQRIKWVHPRYQLPDFVEWSNTIDKFLAESDVDPWEMADVIRWVCGYMNFWNYKILTPKELIARYDELSQKQKMAA